ncbi:MAG: glycosyltransferase [bacterium]
MKLLLVTDGKYPEYVNGVSIYIRYFAEEMVRCGHDIYIFHHIKSGWLNRPKIIHTVENGIVYYGLDNSPIAFFEAMVNPSKSYRERRTEIIFSSILEEINPDLVHFHEFERIPSFCIDLVKYKNIPVFVTLHDYWLICPRLQLFTLSEHICEGPNEGKNCIVNCLSGNFLTRQYRKIIMSLPEGNLHKSITKLRNIYKISKGKNLGQSSSHSYIKKNFSGLKNKKLLESFKKREMYCKNSLTKADIIIAVSNCVKEVFKKQGIEEEKIIVNQLGVKSIDWIIKRVFRFKHYPLRFGFLGHLGPSKGAHLITKAAKTIPPSKAKFFFFGGAASETLYDFQKNIKDLTHCIYKGKYCYNNINSIFDNFDILIIPSLWQETLGMIGLEAQAAGIPLISSDTGGMKDYINDGINGLLFPTGNVEELVKCLTTIIEAPCQIEEMSKRAFVPKSIKEDCEIMINKYKDFSSCQINKYNLSVNNNYNKIVTNYK